MKLDLPRFFQACNPSKTLVVSKAEDRQYYIDFAKVRGGKIIQEFLESINQELLKPARERGCGTSTVG